MNFLSAIETIIFRPFGTEIIALINCFCFFVVGGGFFYYYWFIVANKPPIDFSPNQHGECISL